METANDNKSERRKARTEKNQRCLRIRQTKKWLVRDKLEKCRAFLKMCLNLGELLECCHLYVTGLAITVMFVSNYQRISCNSLPRALFVLFCLVCS